MDNNLLSCAAKLLLDQRRRKYWKKIVSVLAVIVVFCTTYALILPAITMEKKLICGQEEHIHTDACYTENTTLVCQFQEGPGHTHTEACYTDEEVLLCTQEERAGHTHTAECYQEEDVLICGMEESEEHTHTAECYKKNQKLICGQEESEGHTHTAECYGTERVLTCGQDACEAHTHTEDCYKTERILTCEKEEHTHTDDCYSTVTSGDPSADVESQSDWERTMKDVELTGNWSQDVVKIAESQLGYTESTRNFITDEKGAAKGYSRYGAWYGDTYGDWCAMFVSFCLHYAQVEGIPLEANCNRWVEALKQEKYDLYREADTYRPLPGDIVFFDFDDNEKDCEHVGLVAELIPATDTTPEKLKAIEGNSSNKVQYVTYDLDSEYIYGYGQLPEDRDDYICGQRAHQHTEKCYDADGGLFCGWDEHVHDDGCLPVTETETETATNESTTESESAITEGGQGAVAEYICGLEEHEHMEDCYDAEGNLICGLEEHKHTKECLKEAGVETEETQETEATDAKAEEETELTELSYSGPDYTVSVSYGAEAGLPEGVELEVSEILSDSEDYQAYCAQALEALGSEGGSAAEELVFARFFDIRFTLDGEEYEPAAPVSVTITYASVPESDESGDCKAIHFGEDGTEVLDTITEKQEDGSTSFTHTQDSFSVVGSLMSVPTNSTDVGPDSLPVDYYVCIDDEWVCVGTTKTGWYGDYTVTDWSDCNRDYITIEQAKSILGNYGFTGGEDNTARVVAYQQKSVDTNIYSDTKTVEINGQKVIPLARNEEHAGYNLYYLPNNKELFSGEKSLDSVYKTDNGFYTVSVYDPNHLAYAKDSELPETQVVKKGGNTKITVKALGINNAVWQCVNLSWSKVYDQTGTEENGEITFELTNITQTLRITPMINSFGTEIKQSVYYLVFLDGQWTEVGKTTPYYENEEILGDLSRHRYFVTSAQAESVLAPYGFYSSDYSSTIGGTSVLAYQLAKCDLAKEFWTDGGGQQLDDKNWAIGLSYTTNNPTDYSLYYLPVNAQGFQGKKPNSYNSSSSEMKGNRFWSVNVRDNCNFVYTSGELESMEQIASDNGTIIVTVKNADGILWSCVGKNGEELEVESTQSGGYTTFTIKNITQPVEVVATKANPSFTVQYYGNIPRFATSGSNALKVIDTSGEVLPTNGGSMATKSIYLEETGQKTNQNAGVATELYRVATTTELTKLYTEKEYQFESSPELQYFNKLKDNESYTLKEIWVLKEGRNADSINREDWDIYTYQTDTAFTNEAGQAVGNTILINDGAVIRLVSDSSSGDYHNGTTFYDYNISSGQNTDGCWRTGITGINSESNYGISLNEQRGWRSGSDILAFGNSNCGTGMSGYLFDGSALNKFSSINSNYGGCTFGLASGLNSDGTIRYNESIVAPKLFNDGDATGKQTYSNSSLNFDRVGDTYTLSAATLNNSNGQSNTLSGLQYFFNPSPTSGTTHTHIFTNNFWPMDPAAGRTDALWGTYGNPGSFQGFAETNDYKWSNLAANFPVSDDGNAHNWFFGMNFAISFSLTADYEGPLEYYFFGDDDLWVFLDGRLVCDIGGVHSSVGEYVNLRDYLTVGSSGQHTLTFFYTERGASGSTCYMSFTLPSVSSATTAQDTGSLQIAKTVKGADGADYSGETYQFQVDLKTSENGSSLNQTFSYSKSDGTYGTVKSGGKIALKADETVTISGIPAGTYYKVTELSTQGYKVTVNGDEGYIISGKIETGAIKPASFVNTPYYELPDTGGSGTRWYYIYGGLFLIAGLAFFAYKMCKKRREAEP